MSRDRKDLIHGKRYLLKLKNNYLGNVKLLSLECEFIKYFDCHGHNSEDIWRHFEFYESEIYEKYKYSNNVGAFRIIRVIKILPENLTTDDIMITYFSDVFSNTSNIINGKTLILVDLENIQVKNSSEQSIREKKTANALSKKIGLDSKLISNFLDKPSKFPFKSMNDALVAARSSRANTKSYHENTASGITHYDFHSEIPYGTNTKKGLLKYSRKLRELRKTKGGRTRKQKSTNKK